MSKTCLICHREAQEYRFERSGDRPGVWVSCKVCGDYIAAERVARMLMEVRHKAEKPSRESYILSGLTRKHHEKGGRLYLRDLEEALKLAPNIKGPLDAIDQILLHIHDAITTHDEKLFLSPAENYPIAYARNADEFSFYLDKAAELGYLERPENRTKHCYRLSLEGWRRTNELKKTKANPRQAFVAMWFDDEIRPIFKQGISPALRSTGYNPLRIDMKEHNDMIDDQIVAEIKKSGLLVADFTGQRAGVYFEAGLAMGLGIPVIWTCRNDEFSKLHFDTRQYNHIGWESAEDLREKLTHRIEATLPTYPPIENKSSRL